MTAIAPTALIAEDEPLLAATLQHELRLAWPALVVVSVVGDGLSAVARALKLQPDVVFFDIQMPGLDGLSAAAELADVWPANATKPFPALVFVTAFDAYAVQAFEAQAIDYLLKPVQAARLQKTVLKVQLAPNLHALSAIHSEANLKASMAHTLANTVAQLRGLLSPAAAPPAPAMAPLRLIHASLPSAAQGHHTRMVPIGEVLYFEAADKYIRVFTADADYLIRTPLKVLLQRLDAAVFWQVHRGTVVRASAVHTVLQSDVGKLSLTLRHRPETLSVSRLYAHLFKPM